MCAEYSISENSQDTVRATVTRQSEHLRSMMELHYQYLQIVADQIGETDVFSATFSGHEKELREAFQKLDGRELPQGDVGYEIRAFDCMPMRFFFWERDEEFEAQGNILFDYSATDFNHVESAVSIADSGIKRLAELAGVPLRGKSFQMR